MHIITRSYFFSFFSVIGSPSNSACAVRTASWKRTVPDCCRRSASSSIRCRANRCWKSSTPRWPENKRIRSPSISPRISWPRVSTTSKTNSCEECFSFILILYCRGSKYNCIFDLYAENLPRPYRKNSESGITLTRRTYRFWNRNSNSKNWPTTSATNSRYCGTRWTRWIDVSGFPLQQFKSPWTVYLNYILYCIFFRI